MAAIRLRVGAVLDPGAAHIFDSLISSAQRARKAIGKAGADAGSEFTGGYRTNARPAAKVHDDIATSAEKAAQRAAKAAEKAAKEEARAYEYVYQIKQRYLAKEAADAERSLKRQADARMRMLSGAGRTFAGVVGRGVGVAGEIARGAGVDLDIGSLVHRNVETQKTATDITASAYVEGAAGSVGKRQDPRAVIAAAKDAANAAAISEEVALAGLQKFVGKSTDLQTGMELLRGMAIQSKATGSNLEDVMDAAGDIAVKLADTPDKAKILAGVMATVARQGQLGASELRSMAPFIGRIVASSNMFASGTEKAVTELGAAFQITKKMQGQTPASAATSVSRFVDTLTSKKGLKDLHTAGLTDADIFADKGKTKLKDLSQIIPLLLDKAGGDLTKLAKEMPNVKAGAVLKGFAQIYSEGEKTGKGGGAKAVTATFAEYGGAMSQKQIQESLANAMGTTESKVQLFNNRMQAIADDTLPKLIPAFEKLAPKVEQLADGIAAVAVYVADNPLKAAVGAMGASLLKEVAAAGIKSAFESSLKGALAGGLGGALGLTLAVAAVTLLATDVYFTAKDKAANDTSNTEAGALNAREVLRGGRERGVVAEADVKEAEARARVLENRINAAEAPTDRNRAEATTGAVAGPVAGLLAGAAVGLMSGALNFATGGSVGTGFGKQAQLEGDRADLAGMKAELAGLKGEIAKIHSGTLSVKIVGGIPGQLGGPAPGSTSGPQPVR